MKKQNYAKNGEVQQSTTNVQQNYALHKTSKYKHLGKSTTKYNKWLSSLKYSKYKSLSMKYNKYLTFKANSAWDFRENKL